MGDYDMTAGPSRDNHTIPNTQLCKETHCAGFDFNMGSNWIYPINKPLRSYQDKIIQKCLYNNTLVVLPTGLGKTFIAAVIMYNFYRWYPRGKIIFVAPTKPLVFQQKTACTEIMGISKDDSVEITGQLSKQKRSELWKSKRVFFATPQVVENDLNTVSTFPFSLIKLIIFDEAHKAKGKYSYCEIARKINQLNTYFRVIGLSATPGLNITDVVEVVKNLLISHIELRHIDSPDISSYIHKTNIVTVVVQLDEDLEIHRKEYKNIIRPYVENLRNAKAIVGTIETLSKNWLIMQHQKFREKCENHPNYREINTNFSLCTSLYHGLELLVRNGLKVFMNFFGEDNQKVYYCFQRDYKLTAFLDEIKNVVNLKDDTYFGHPKFDCLREKLLCHFLNNADSRAIVFCEYRFCVSLILNLLKNCLHIKPKILVGQSNSSEFEKITQKAQKETLNDFKAGICNVLISTSVGEEGLDIGDVDLIVCFDMNTKNSSRFVQRIGRTGRKRSGNVIMLVTKGKEEDNLRDALKNQYKTNNQILNSPAVTNSLFQHSHRLIPQQFNPECLETYMTPVWKFGIPITSSKVEKKINRNKPKNINSYFTEITKTIPNKVEKVSAEILPIVISDDEDSEPNLPTISKKDENLHDKINLFEKRLNQNKFYSSIVKDGKNKLNYCTERYALIDVTNLISDVDQIRDQLKTFKVDEINIERRKSIPRAPEVEDDYDYSFSQNISSFLKPETDYSANKMNVTKLSTWSSPSTSDRFDLNVYTVEDLFEGSWKSEGNLGNLDHWKNCSRNTTDNLEEQIKEKNHISDILSQSVLNISHDQNLEIDDKNDNKDEASSGDEYIFIPQTPEHLKQYSLSPEISPSIFDTKKRRRRMDNITILQSSTELSRKNIIESEEVNHDLIDTQVLHEAYSKLNDRETIESTEKYLETHSRLLFENNKKSPKKCDSKTIEVNDTQFLNETNSTVNDLETIESSQTFLETNRPRLRRLLFGNNKKSPKKCDSKIIEYSENKMSSSLINESEVFNNFNDSSEEENADDSIKNISKYKKNIFIDDEAIDSSKDSETELNDDHLPDDSIVDHSYNSVNNSTIDMTKMYLESVKLPINNHGYKIPEKRRTYMSNIFSQVVLPDDSILEDSFINESIQVNDEEDELDRAEEILNKRSKKRKRRVVDTSVVKVVKRRRYVVFSDSSQDS